jgi:hypothetical protein
LEVLDILLLLVLEGPEVQIQIVVLDLAAHFQILLRRVEDMVAGVVLEMPDLVDLEEGEAPIVL